MSRVPLIASLVSLVLVSAVPTAHAQQQRTDPEASSPAGVIYEIPFDSARKDATPQSGRGEDPGEVEASAGGGDDGGSTAAGTPATGGSGDDGGSGGGGSNASEGNPNVGTSIHSENGFGSSSQVPGVDGAVVQGDGPADSALRDGSSASDVSPAGTYGLLALVALVGAWVGVSASRRLRT